MYIFLITSIIGTIFAKRVERYHMGWAGGKYLAMMWSLVGLAALITCLTAFEWKFEIFTPRKQRITTYSRPKGMSWFLVKKPKGEVVPEDGQGMVAASP